MLFCVFSSTWGNPEVGGGDIFGVPRGYFSGFPGVPRGYYLGALGIISLGS